MRQSTELYGTLPGKECVYAEAGVRRAHLSSAVRRFTLGVTETAGERQCSGRMVFVRLWIETLGPLVNNGSATVNKSVR